MIKRFFAGAVMLISAVSGVSAQSLDKEQLLDLLSAQRYKEAAAFIRTAYPDSIPDVKLQARLAFCYYMSGNLATAEKEYVAALDRDSTNRTVLGYLASINEQRRNYTKAKAIYARVLRIDSLSAPTYKKLAYIADQQRDTVAYLQNLVKANRLDPENSDYAYELANFYIKRKKYDAADSVLAPAMKADPQDVSLVETRAELAHGLKNWKQLVDYAKQAINLGSERAQTINLLGIGQYYTKQYKECIQTYSVFEGTAFANETTYYYIALSWRQLGDYKKSNEYLQKTIADGISDNVPIYYQELSVNNRVLRKYSVSIAQLNKGEEFEPKNSFNYARARIYDEDLHDIRNAIKFYRLYVKKYDAFTDDRQSYEYCKARIAELASPLEKR